MSKVLITGEYVNITGGVPTIRYYQTDHLGNIRQVLSSDGVLQEQNDYYSFGMRQLREDSPLLASNKYKYNGKELETFNNFETLDYGARMYDAQIGRWHSIDLASEEYFNLSTYNYCANNPIFFTDPDGTTLYALTSSFITPGGEIIEHRNDGDRTIYIVPNPEIWNGEKDGLDVYSYEKPGVSYETNIGNNIKNVGYLLLNPRKYPYDPPD